MDVESTNVVDDTTPEPEPTEEPIISEPETTGVEPPVIDEPPQIPDDYQTKMDKRIGKEVARTKTERTARVRAEHDAAYWRGKAEGAPAPKAEPPKPIPTIAKPQEDQFETYNEFVEALTDWKTDQKKAEWDLDQQRKDEERSLSASQESFQTKMNEGSAKYEDFDEVALSNAVPITAIMADIIQGAEIPADIAYYLGSHIHEATTIARLPAVQAARVIGQIEAKLLAAQAANPTPPKPKTTKAPPPIVPLGGGPEIVTKDPAKMTQEEYVKWRQG